MDNRLTLTAVVIVALLFFFVCMVTNVCCGQNYGDPQLVYMMGEINRLRDKMDVLVEAQAEARENLAEMRGEMRGRQNATTGVAAGVPTGLAGLLAWWLRRERREK